MNDKWNKCRRIVVKIGSSLLVDYDSGNLNTDWLSSLADDIAELRQRGREVIIVSSGAIALGRTSLGLAGGTLRLDESQAAASVGQIALAHSYQEVFKARELVVAQILLTLSDTEQRRRYLNARNTVTTLLDLGAVPVVNENDTVATSEIRYGDNDRLAARVGSMMSADCVVLLSDVDGLYTAPPNSHPKEHGGGELVELVPDITTEIEAMAGDVGTELSRGGMVTKIEAAKISVASGAHLVISSGKVNHPLKAIAEGRPCTWFVADDNPVTSRKRWIAAGLEENGTLRIDSGARQALKNGKSLLPAGIVAIEGRFEKGDAVRIATEDGQEIGRGLTAYDHTDANRIKGRNSREISDILGYRGKNEVVHRDDMVLKRK
ncbi:MAG: glutamate 5-kinase [Methyloligellaceae bacterium]